MHLGCNRYMTHYAFLYTFFMVYEKLVCMGASPPPLKNTTPFFSCQASLKSANCTSPLPPF